MIVDCHTHCFPDHLADKAMTALHAAYQAVPVATPTVSGLLRQMTEVGVNRAVVAPVATKPSQVGPINDWVISLQAEKQLIPFGSLHPRHPDLPCEVIRLVQAGIKGIKLQPHFQGFRLEDQPTLRMFEIIGDRLLVLMHAGDEIRSIADIQPTPERIARLLRYFPKLRLIAAHAGGYQMWDEVERRLVGRQLLLDLSYVFGHINPDQLKRIIQHHGPERIVWGSDFPWQSQGYSLSSLRELRLPEPQLRDIMARNILRELSLVPTPR
jgi:predicted TIM-barrel fold metal-dependent hydrolase